MCPVSQQNIYQDLVAGLSNASDPALAMDEDEDARLIPAVLSPVKGAEGNHAESEVEPPAATPLVEDQSAAAAVDPAIMEPVSNAHVAESESIQGNSDIVCNTVSEAGADAEAGADGEAPLDAEAPLDVKAPQDAESDDLPWQTSGHEWIGRKCVHHGPQCSILTDHV